MQFCVEANSHFDWTKKWGAAHPTREAGHGSTIEEALEDTLRRFTHLLNQLEPRTEADFAWSDPSEF